jgi:hypothetical protein
MNLLTTSPQQDTSIVTASSQRSALAWQAAEANLKRVAKRDDNWDGNGSLSPIPECIEEAQRFLREMFESARQSHHASVQWMAPTINSNEIGEIVLEWWHKERDITIFIRKNKSITFLKTWGTHIYDDMQEGIIFNMDDIKTLSEWLRGG